MRIKYLISFCIVIITQQCAFAQKFSIQPGAGMGSTFSFGREFKRNGSVHLSLSGYYFISPAFSAGIEFSTTDGSLNSFSRTAEQDPVNPPPGSNTLTLAPSQVNGGAILAKLKYAWGSRKVRPYSEIGIGINTYRHGISNTNPPLKDNAVKKTNMAFQPEFGLQLNKFQLSLFCLFGGKTPAYASMKDSGENIVLNSISLNGVFLRMGYRFEIGKANTNKLL